LPDLLLVSRLTNSTSSMKAVDMKQKFRKEFDWVGYILVFMVPWSFHSS
jgi:hypothetical protein